MVDQATTPRPLTYDGPDVAEYLSLADPTTVGLDRIVASIKQASAGAPFARLIAYRFAIHCAKRDDPALAAWFDEVWDYDGPIDDLRDLAREQAKVHRDLAFDAELSDNHPDLIAAMVAQYQGLANDMDDWAARPRRDMLSVFEADAAKAKSAKPWPLEILYERKQVSKHARLFCQVRPWKTLSSDGMLHTFKDRHWQVTTDAQMEAEVRSTDPSDTLDVEHVSKLVRGIHQLTHTPARPFEWVAPVGDEPAPQDLALFANGLLNVSESSLIPHDGRYFATGLPAVDWDPFAECPTWMKWLDETLDPSFHATLQEWMGYCLTPDVRAHKFGVFIGGPRSGKSTAHNVLCGLLGSHAASSTMADLSGDFGLEGLTDKRLILLPDAHDARATGRSAALERIKAITGADPISVNRKGKQLINNAVLKARLLVTCNKMPRFIDESGALAARMLIVQFDRSFIGREDRTMPERLGAEMPGIANWALQGLLRLRANGLRFSIGEAGRERAEMAALSQSPAKQFAEAALDVTGVDEDFTPMPAIHRAYLNWATEQGVSREGMRSQTALAEDLVAALNGVRYTQRRIAGVRTYGLAGVKAVSPMEPDLDD